MANNVIEICCYWGKDCRIYFPVYNENYVLQKGLYQCEECYGIQLNVSENED